MSMNVATVPAPAPSFLPPANTVELVESTSVASKESVRKVFGAVRTAFENRRKNPKLGPVQLAYLAKTKDGEEEEGGLFTVVGYESKRGAHGTVRLTLRRERNGKVYESVLDSREDGSRILTIDAIF